MKLQEREIARKQEGLVALRDQLDSVKGNNADLYVKLQVARFVLVAVTYISAGLGRTPVLRGSCVGSNFRCCCCLVPTC